MIIHNIEILTIILDHPLGLWAQPVDVIDDNLYSRRLLFQGDRERLDQFGISLFRDMVRQPALVTHLVIEVNIVNVEVHLPAVAQHGHRFRNRIAIIRKMGVGGSLLAR